MAEKCEHPREAWDYESWSEEWSRGKRTWCKLCGRELWVYEETGPRR